MGKLKVVLRKTGIAAGTLCLAAIAVAMAGPASGAETAATPGNSDREQIERLEERHLDAWERCDAAGFAAVFSPDGDVVTFNGDHFATRKGIQDGMRYAFENYCQHTRIQQQDRRVQFPTPDTAVIVRDSCLINPGESDCRAGSRSVNTNVLVKRHGTWLYRSFQNTRVTPLP